MPERLTLTILHEIPGRLRMALSHPPRDAEKMGGSVTGHDGIVSFRYTDVTRTVLVNFEPAQITREEILVRTAFSLSLDWGAAPVRILTQPESREITASAFISGLVLLAALGTRLFRGPAGSFQQLERVSSLLTAAAVVGHGWREFRTRGYFDPEVLSLVYLLTAFIRGNFIGPAIFTWVTTFGRHLVHRRPLGAELRPIELAANSDESPRYEIVVGPDSGDSERHTIFTFVPALVQYVLLGGGGLGEAGLPYEIRTVARFHGQVLEGLGNMRTGIPVRFR